MALRIIGKELPELLGDGYLVYLLHHSSPQIVQAAVECCSNSARNSRMLIPALVKHLPNAVLRAHVVEALKWFDPSDLWEALYQYTDDMVGLSKRGGSIAQPPSASRDKREALSGALKVVEAGSFPFEDKLSLLLHLVETLMVGSKAEEAETEERQAEEKLDVLQYLFGKDNALEELVVDALISLVRLVVVVKCDSISSDYRCACWRSGGWSGRKGNPVLLTADGSAPSCTQHQDTRGIRYAARAETVLRDLSANRGRHRRDIPSAAAARGA